MKGYNGTFLNHPVQPVKAAHEISGLSSLITASGKIRLDCPVCGLVFERYACWAKRQKVSYCSKACADEGKRRPVEVPCATCGTMFISTPSEVAHHRVSTCSKECSSALRSSLVAAGVLLNNPKRSNRDSGHAAAKLTGKQVAEIASSEEQTSLLAAKFQVSRTLIRNIRRKRRLALEGTPC